jgi:hypothetical protein
MNWGGPYFGLLIEEEGICFCRVYIFHLDYLGIWWVGDINIAKFRIVRYF